MRIDEENLTDGSYNIDDLTGRAGRLGGDFTDLSYMDDYDDGEDGTLVLGDSPEDRDAEIANYLSNGRGDDLVNEAGQNITAEDMEKMLVQEGFSIDDPVRLYLKEIGKVALLTGEEEADLAKKVYEGLEAATLLEELHKPIDEPAPAEDQTDPVRNADEGLTLNPEESEVLEPVVDEAYIKELEKQVRVGERAKNRLVEANLRLVVSIAKRHSGKGLSFLDLIQEGNLGLLKAAEKFDYRKGYKFSTYATWWIRQAISRAVADQARTIRIPVHMVETIHRLSKVSRKLNQDLGREPTVEELAVEMNMTSEKVREVMRIALDPVSLETPIGEEEDSHLGDFIQDDSALVPSDSVFRTMLREELLKELHSLSPREENVILLRYGLKDNRIHTLEEVGAQLNITRERVRQIEAKALRKIRGKINFKRKHINDYLG